jgi:hypothetical protein
MKTAPSNPARPKRAETRFIKLQGPGRQQQLTIPPLKPPGAPPDATPRRRAGLVCDAPLGLKT